MDDVEGQESPKCYTVYYHTIKKSYRMEVFAYTIVCSDYSAHNFISCNKQ